MMKRTTFITAILCTLFITLFFLAPANAASSNANVVRLSTAVTNVTTAAYVVLSASIPIPTHSLLIANGTSSVIMVATGSAGNEIGLVAVGPTSTVLVALGATLPMATRLTLEAVDATASANFVTVSLIP